MTARRFAAGAYVAAVLLLILSVPVGYAMAVTGCWGVALAALFGRGTR